MSSSKFLGVLRSSSGFAVRNAVVLLLALCVALPLPAGAQESSRFGASIEVSIMNVDVIVTDRAGRHVRGLTQSDFEIYEDGKLQPISNFAEYRGEAASRVVVANASAPSVTTEVAPPQKRTMVIFVDRIPVYGRERVLLFNGVKTFLRKSVRPGDSVAIASWASGARAAQEFTGDLNKLEAALEQLARERGKAERSEWEAINFDRTQLEWYYAASASRGMSGGTVGTSASEYDATARVVLDVRQKARALDAIMQTMAGAEGQKILVMFSSRFAPNSGAEYSGSGNANAVTAENQIEAMLRTAKANGIRIYPLYARIGDMDLDETASSNNMQGLGSQQNTLRVNETSSLGRLATETGGVAGTGLGDLDRILAQAAEDFDSYYSLGYRATTAANDRQKRITVKVKNDAYRVRTRREVVNKSNETLMRQRILASLMQPPKIEGLPVFVYLNKARQEKAILYLPLDVKVPLSALTLLPEGEKQSGGFTVYVAWAGAMGTISDVTKRSQTISISAAELAASKGKTITYQVEVAATRGVEKLAIAVVDDVSQEVGLVRFDLPKAKSR